MVNFPLTSVLLEKLRNTIFSYGIKQPAHTKAFRAIFSVRKTFFAIIFIRRTRHPGTIYSVKKIIKKSLVRTYTFVFFCYFYCVTFTRPYWPKRINMFLNNIKLRPLRTLTPTYDERPQELYKIPDVYIGKYLRKKMRNFVKSGENITDKI